MNPHRIVDLEPDDNVVGNRDDRVAMRSGLITQGPSNWDSTLVVII
jgi:hypothetical protein